VAALNGSRRECERLVTCWDGERRRIADIKAIGHNGSHVCAWRGAPPDGARYTW